MGQRVRKTGSFGGRAARCVGKNSLAAGFTGELSQFNDLVFDEGKGIYASTAVRSAGSMPLIEVGDHLILIWFISVRMKWGVSLVPNDTL